MCHFVLVFFSPFSIAITSLGEERANLSAFRTFVRFVLVCFCQFPLPLGVREGLRFVIVALPRLFSYLFLYLLLIWDILAGQMKSCWAELSMKNSFITSGPGKIDWSRSESHCLYIRAIWSESLQGYMWVTKYSKRLQRLQADSQDSESESSFNFYIYLNTDDKI